MKPDETKSDQATPEELLKILDQQIAEQRKRRKNTPMRRAIILTGGLLLILGGLLASLLLFQYMTREMPRHPRGTPAAGPE
jgi:hypothetical protein